MILFFFFFQAEDGIRDVAVTGVQTCALPIYGSTRSKDRDFYRSGRHVESNDTNRYAEPGRPPRFLRAGFGLSFGGLGSNRLIDLEKGHLQFAEEVQE